MKLPQLSYAPKGLQCTDEDFHALHLKAQGRGARTSISTEALRHLLHDHSALYVRLEEVDSHLRHPEPGKTLLEAPSDPVQGGMKLTPHRRGRGKHVDPLLEDDEDLIG